MSARTSDKLPALAAGILIGFTSAVIWAAIAWGFWAWL